MFTSDYTNELLNKQFETKSLKGFGVSKLADGIIAAGSVLHYLNETQHYQREHILGIRRIEEEKYVWMDRFTIRNLELFHSPTDDAVTLIDILDEKLILMAPFSPTELQKKLKPLKSYNLLKGYRGSSEYSLKKLCEAASKISYLALDFNEYINEIDINPIIILENNAIAVDNVFISKN